MVGAGAPPLLVPHRELGQVVDDVGTEGGLELAAGDLDRHLERLGGGEHVETLALEDVLERVAQHGQLEPVVGVAVAQHDGVQVLGRDVPLEVGQGAGPGVHHHGGTALRTRYPEQAPSAPA